jgi:hypothetical protein
MTLFVGGYDPAPEDAARSAEMGQGTRPGTRKTGSIRILEVRAYRPNWKLSLVEPHNSALMVNSYGQLARPGITTIWQRKKP